MNIVAIIGAILQIILLWLKTKTERDAEKKKKKQEILQEASNALKNRDSSAITTAFDRLRRL